MQPHELQNRIQSWLRTRPAVFQLRVEPDGARLTEVETGKTLHLPAERIRGIETKNSLSTGAEYLLLDFETGPPLAIADAGFVFSLDARNTGELRGAPPTMSFRDHHRLFRHLLHLVEQQDQPDRRREALDVTMILIASLDGARATGLSTQSEEDKLEKVIRRLEAGA